MSREFCAPDLSEVGVIIPALNEAAALGPHLARLLALRPAQVVVVDNGSTDETAAVAIRAGALVVREPRRGYGAACAAGIAALDRRLSVVAFMDADASDDPSQLAGLVRPILEGRADLVIGCRAAALREPGALSTPQRFGNALATWLIRLRWGYRYRDLGPFRAIRRDALERLNMRDRAFGWTVEMQVRALQKGLRIQQVDVSYRRRIGRSKISGTLIGAARAGYCILTTIGRCALRG